jgi:hypothetical protein
MVVTYTGFLLSITRSFLAGICIVLFAGLAGLKLIYNIIILILIYRTQIAAKQILAKDSNFSLNIQLIPIPS